jgi:hypothetical protein
VRVHCAARVIHAPWTVQLTGYTPRPTDEKDAIARQDGTVDSYVFALFPCPAGVNRNVNIANFRNSSSLSKRKIDIDIPLNSIEHIIDAERMFRNFNNGDPGLAGAVGQEIAQEYHKV